MSRTKFMGIFLIILGVISVVVGIVRGDMTSSAAMFIGYLVPALLGAMILIVDHIGGGESKTETGPSDAALAGQKNKKKKKINRIRNWKIKISSRCFILTIISGSSKILNWMYARIV